MSKKRRFKIFPDYFLYIIILVVQILLVRLLASLSYFSDYLYPKFYNYFSTILINITNSIPFALGDILYLILIVFAGRLLFLTLVYSFERDWKKVKLILNRLLILINIFVFIFHVFWGINYYKKPISDNFIETEPNILILKNLAEFYFEQSKKMREKADENENGIFILNLSERDLNTAITQAKKKACKNNPQFFYKNNQQINLKKSLLSLGFSYLGVLGYYNPFTAEATYVTTESDTKKTFTYLHEVAHQWGYARESEASFIGYLVGVNSDNYNILYATYYKTLNSLLNKIVWEDPIYVDNMLTRYSTKMKRDRAYDVFLQEKYQGSASDAFSMLNDAYLYANNQNGLESYGKFIDLVVGYHQSKK